MVQQAFYRQISYCIFKLFKHCVNASLNFATVALATFLKNVPPSSCQCSLTHHLYYMVSQATVPAFVNAVEDEKSQLPCFYTDAYKRL